MASNPRRTILFLTNSEYGEANVIIAVSHELLRRGNCDVHIASYSILSKRIADLENGAFGGIPKDTTSITLHPFTGLSMHEVRRKKFGVNDIHHKPGLKGAIGMNTQMAELAATWTGEDWVRICNECRDTITSTKPDIVVVDSYFYIGVDACRNLGCRYMILSPNTFMEVTSDQISLFGRIVKYPSKGSGYPFPLRRRQIPPNIYLFFNLAAKFATAPAAKDIKKARKAHGIKGPIPYYKPYLKEVTYMLPSTPECDFPIPIPDNFVCCGPIFVPSSLDADPELKAWLSKRKTVLLNLGSFWKAEGEHAKALANGIDIFLSKSLDLQLLWKLQYSDAIPADVEKILHEHLSSERVRIEKWLKVEPSTIVLSEQVICSVHHGGSNSYFEAVSAGIPHIILPAWNDTYEFAARVEYFGIGVYGSKKSKSAPGADGVELGEALLLVTGDSDEGKVMKEKARKLADVVNAYGGRSKAADTILEMCAGKEKEKSLSS